MADDETTDATEETKAPKEPRATVALPVWALVLVGVLAAGGIGYAIGNSNDDSRNVIDPIADVRSAPGNDDQGNDDGQANGEACPRPPDGQLQGPGAPGNGPGGLPGGPLGPGGGPGFGPGSDDDRGERGDRDQDEDENQDQDQESESNF